MSQGLFTLEYEVPTYGLFYFYFPRIVYVTSGPVYLTSNPLYTAGFNLLRLHERKDTYRMSKNVLQGVESYRNSSLGNWKKSDDLSWR